MTSQDAAITITEIENACKREISSFKKFWLQNSLFSSGHQTSHEISILQLSCLPTLKLI